MSKFYIGIDNGVSGSIAYVGSDYTMVCTPVRKELDYPKTTKRYLNRIIFPELVELLENWIIHMDATSTEDPLVLVERPMVNPKRFVSTVSALRAFESTLNALELLRLPYRFIDSKQWQKEMLPKGITGSDNLKQASKSIGKRLFPRSADIIIKRGDADSLLMAEWARRSKL